MRRVLIVGNSAAGVSAAIAARKESPESPVQVIGLEPYPAYHRPRLTYALGKRQSVQSYLLHPHEWYASQNINVTTGVSVVSGGQGYVQDHTGNRYEYDSLVVATGGLSNMPPLPGVDRKGVFSLRTYDDLVAIEEHGSGVEDVVIVGGGLLGLEAAWSFRQWGKRVTVLERGTGLLKNQLDEAGMRLLGEIVERKGVHVAYGSETQRVTGSDVVDGVLLKDGRHIDAGLILMSTGVRPNVALPQALGLKVNRGVVVDEAMKAAPGIYAAGDVAELNGKVSGIWPVAEGQGAVAGANAAGGRSVYREVAISNTTMVMGTVVFSAGDVGRGEGPYDVKTSGDGKGDYNALYIRAGRLVGAIIIGSSGRKAARVKAAIDQSEPLSDDLQRRTAEEIINLL